MTDRPQPSGRVVAICLGPGGIPKRPVDEAQVGPLGFEGDAHRYVLHGGTDRALCLFSTEDYASLNADGVAAKPPGAFGENVLTEGIDYAQLRAGDRLELGDEVVIELFDIREPCATLKKVDRRFPDLMVGRSGFVCRVVRGGLLRPGAAVRRCADGRG